MNHRSLPIVPSPAFTTSAPSREVHRSHFIADLYRKYSVTLMRFLGNRFGGLLSRQELEEVSQETYLAVFRLDDPNTIDNPRSYLFKTAANLAIDVGRRENVRARTLQTVSTTAAGAGQSVTTPEQIASDREHLNLLYRAILDLPPRCRQVFVLHRFHGWSHDKISRHLGVTIHAVEKHIMRALKRCEARMSAEAGESP